MRNPFDTGPVEDAERFFGRASERAFIDHIVDAGRHPPHSLRNVLVIGDPGTGKTSMLHYATGSGRGQGYYVVTAKADDFTTEIRPLYSYLHFTIVELLSLAQRDDLFAQIPGFYNTYAGALQSLPGIDPAQLIRIGTLRFPAWYYGYANRLQSTAGGASPLPAWRNDIKAILEEADNRRKVPGCIFLLDDVDGWTKSEVEGLIDAIRGVADELHGCRAMFVVAGGQPVRRTSGQHGGVFAKVIEVRPWNRSEVQGYLRRPEVEALGHVVTDERADEFITISGGSPRTLAVLAAQVYESCANGRQRVFAPTPQSIEETWHIIDPSGQPAAMDLATTLKPVELVMLADIAPFVGWTIEEIARYHTFVGDAESGVMDSRGDFERRKQELRRTRDSYVRSGLLLDAPTIEMSGGPLVSHYLRYKARSYGVAWAEQYPQGVPTYGEWVHEALERQTSKLATFPVRHVMSWIAHTPASTDSLEDQVAAWARQIWDGTALLTTVEHATRVVEQPTGDRLYTLAAAPHSLDFLASPNQTVKVNMLAIQYAIKGHGHATAQLYQVIGAAPTHMDDAMTALLEALKPTTAMLDVEMRDHWYGSVDLPGLEQLVHIAEQMRNDALIRQCLADVLALGRSSFWKGRIDESRQWFKLAAGMSETLIPSAELAIAHNNYGFVSMAFKEWDLAKLELLRALESYSSDTTTSNRAQTLQDLAFVELQRRDLDSAEHFCQDALAAPNCRIRTGFLWVKLCDVPSLKSQTEDYWDAELARRPRIDAATYCTLAAIRAMREDWGEAERWLEQAQSVDGQHYMVLRAVGRFYLARDHRTDALELFRKAREAYIELMEQLYAQEGQTARESRAILDEIELTCS